MHLRRRAVADRVSIFLRGRDSRLYVGIVGRGEFSGLVMITLRLAFLHAFWRPVPTERQSKSATTSSAVCASARLPREVRPASVYLVRS